MVDNLELNINGPQPSAALELWGDRFSCEEVLRNDRDRLIYETHLRASSSLNLFFKSGDTISGL